MDGLGAVFFLECLGRRPFFAVSVVGVGAQLLLLLFYYYFYLSPPLDVNYGTSLIALVRKHCYVLIYVFY